MLGDQTREEINTVGDVTRLVTLKQLHRLLHSRHDAVTLEHEMVGVISGFGHDTFDDHVVRDRCLGECDRTGIGQQAIERGWQFIVKNCAVRRHVKMRQVFGARARNLGDETLEGLNVLGLLPEEAGQKHFLLEPTVTRHGHDQR